MPVNGPLYLDGDTPESDVEWNPTVKSDDQTAGAGDWDLKECFSGACGSEQKLHAPEVGTGNGQKTPRGGDSPGGGADDGDCHHHCAVEFYGRCEGTASYVKPWYDIPLFLIP